MLNLHQIQTFVTVISEGSMTAAADKLYLTQPAVSQQIRNLEEDLGVELLVRGVRQIKATAHGEILYDHAKKILLQAQQAEIAVKSMGSKLKGDIKIATLNSIGLQIMSPVVSRLLRYNPELHLKVHYDHGEQLVEQFLKNQIDAIILPEVKKEFNKQLEDTEKRFVLKEEMWLVGNGKDSEIPREINMSDLGSFPYVSFATEYPGFQKELSRLLAQKNTKVNTVFESTNVGTLKRVIESGLGWGFLPAHSVKKQVRSGRLIHTHVQDFHYEIDIVYYFKKNAEHKTLIETLFQAMSTQEKG